MFVGDLNIVVGIQDSVAKELEIVGELETTFVKTVQVTGYVTTSRTYFEIPCRCSRKRLYGQSNFRTAAREES